MIRAFKMPILTPEQEAREQIDHLLEAAGWQVQTRAEIKRTAALGVAVCEFPLTTGQVDYMLFADGRPIGVVEAKPAGTPLSGVEPQAIKYCAGLPPMLQPLAWHDPLPFRYESTGIETYFADDRDPDARSRHVFTFHRPETLIRWAEQGQTLRAWLRQMPPLDPKGLWRAQARTIRNLERSLAQGRPRALIHMATGSGKTCTAVNLPYRLIKHAEANRVLFMVDRTNLRRAERLRQSILRRAFEGRLVPQIPMANLPACCWPASAPDGKRRDPPRANAKPDRCACPRYDTRGL